MPEQAGEKTEQATPRRLEEALKKGQFARSAEIQTVFVLCAGMIAMKMAGGETWNKLGLAFVEVFGNLHRIEVGHEKLQAHFIQGIILIGLCVAPVVVGTLISSLLAGGIQSRFNTASEALTPDWERVNPGSGFKRIFSVKALVPTSLSMIKLLIVGAICWSGLRNILHDPIFHTAIPPAEIARFLAGTGFQLGVRILLALAAIAAVDYTYQFWKTNRDLMMTKEELKDEMKNTEGNPQMKARQRRRKTQKTQRQMFLEVPQADVVVTNPTHIAIALKYDRKNMKAPKIIAKGTRLNALKIREIASAHQVPIIENKPVARMMFKYGRVGGEIPAELYAAVAEILAVVYRTNRYRYYSEQVQK